MIRGDKAGLRARHEDDVRVLHRELYDDVATRSRADSRAWRPIVADSAESPYAVTASSDEAACFSVVDLKAQELAGEALLWNIDTHNRNAHLGISLLPAFRGRGLGGDVVRLLCHCGFVVRGLQRLQVETLADNAPMIAAATGAGFPLRAPCAPPPGHTEVSPTRSSSACWPTNGGSEPPDRR
ncbi:GNAT family protein [Streptomyces sp. NPDC048275]|uniref:GNAT family N-acetyltransferase n=1 Tax=Streptomyces sp. NPDC048275 TaxID=3155629 RepID=UPI0033DEB87C